MAKSMKKHKCNECDFVYDPLKGQLATGVKSNTAWEDVPETWRCPVCGAAKSNFHEID